MVGLIVARSKNNVIGKNGEIPWKIKGEQKQFRELTTGNVVVMGRKSYEEIGHPLPNRKTIVVSRRKKYTGDNLVTVSSLQEAIEVAGDENIYIAGGCGLYEESMSLVDKMYITEVDLDTFKRWLYDGKKQRKPFAKYKSLNESIKYNDKGEKKS